MSNQFLKMIALSTALLLGTASAYALDATVNAGSNAATVHVGAGNGPLATVNNSGDATNGGSTTAGDVNLGGLLAPLGGGPGGGAGGTGGGAGGVGIGGGAGGVQAAVASLSAGDQQTLKLRCRDVLASPNLYKSNAVALCRMIAEM